MGNVVRVLKRDLLRLLKAPAALVVVIALLFIPSAYTWYNVLGFWNPYDNTAGMRVAVVNLDQGGSSDLTGNLNVGDQIISSLKENNQLDWQFDDEETAMSDLEAGKDYAVFVIPEDFTQNLLSLTTGQVVQPVMKYYVNEKTGPVAPKVTDSGATTLEETINSTFVSTVSEAVVSTLTDAVGQSKDSLDSSSSEVSGKIDQALATIDEVRDALSEVSSDVSDTRSKVTSASSALDGSDAAFDAAAEKLNALSASTTQTQERVATMSSVSLADLSQALGQLEQIKEMLDKAGYGENVEAASEDISAAISLIASAGLPELTDIVLELGETCGQLGAITSEQKALVYQAQAVLDQLDATLATSQESLDQTDALLKNLKDDLDTVRVDVIALAQSAALASLLDDYGLDADTIADFMGSPVQLRTEHLYQLNAYGAAMAPLFMNLTFWIGAFCLLVIMKQEVDDEGIEKLTVRQRYLSRFILFAVFAVIQALICCAGVLFLGVQAVNVPALFFAAAMASLAYLSVIYCLSVLLLHIGKGICIVLVFLQIPAATGLYPIEMTSPFYQAISPFFPFTYGINAMREAICGFYGNDYFYYVGMLFVFFALFLVLGLALRPLTSNVNRMAAHQVRQSGIFNGETVEIPERRFKLTQVISMLTDKEEYRQNLIARYERFEVMYPRFITGSVILGVTVGVAFCVANVFTEVGKVVLLTILLVWVVLTFVFLVVVENLRYNFEKQLEIGDVPEDLLAGLASTHGRMVTSGNTLSEDAVAVADAISGASQGGSDEQAEGLGSEVDA